VAVDHRFLIRPYLRRHAQSRLDRSGGESSLTGAFGD
jgi:hypothetical protein